MSEQTEVKKAGRPKKYTGQVLETIISLLKENTALATKTILKDSHNIDICLPTLLKIGHENNLIRKPGAPKKQKVVENTTVDNTVTENVVDNTATDVVDAA